MKKLIKAFIYLNIIFALYNLYLNNFEFIDYKRVLIPSLIISITLFIIHLIALKVKGYSINETPHFILNNLNLEEIKKIAGKNSWKIILEKKDNLVFKTTKFSFLSFGEKIIIKKNESGHLIIESKSLFPLTVFDFGKNLDNLKVIKSS